MGDDKEKEMRGDEFDSYVKFVDIDTVERVFTPVTPSICKKIRKDRDY